MKKRSLAVLLLSLLLACSLGAATVAFADDPPAAQAQQTTLKQMLDGVIAAGKDDANVYGKTITGDAFDYALGYGEVGETVDFHAYEESSGGLKSAASYNSAGYKYGIYTAGNRLRFGKTVYDAETQTTSYDGKLAILVKMTVKQNVLLRITNAAVSAKLDDTYSFSLYQVRNGKLSALQIRKGTQIGAENSLGGEFQVKAGSILYYEFKRTGNTIADTTDAGLWPTFTADPSSYVPVTRYEKSLYDDVLPETVAANRGAVEVSEETTYQVGYVSLDGNITLSDGNPPTITAISDVTAGSFQAFDKYLNDALQTDALQTVTSGTAYSSVYFGGSGKFIRTDPVNNRYFAMKITSTVDTVVHLEHPAYTQTGAAAYLAFSAEHSVQEDTYSMPVTDGLHRFAASSEVAENAVDTEIHIRANDTLYIVLIGANHGTQIKFMPTIVIETVGFDEDKALDFTWLEELAAAKKDALDEAQQTFDALQRSDYPADNYAAIRTLLDRAKADIGSAGALSAVTARLETFKTELSAILTTAQIAAAKTTEKARLDAYAAGFDAADYAAEDWTRIGALVQDGKAAIDAATPLTAAALAAITDDYMAEMDAVETNGVVATSLQMIQTVYAFEGDGDQVLIGETSTLSFALGHGTYTDMLPFDKFTNDALQTQASNADGYAAVYAGGGGTRLIRTDVTQNEYFIIRLTADENMLLSLRNAAVQSASNGGGTLTVVQSTVRNERTYYATVYQKTFATEAIAKNSLDCRLHVPAGDSVYVVMNGSRHGTNMYLYPDFFIQTGAHYEAGKAYDFTSAIALAVKKDETTAQVNTLTADMNRDDYSEYYFGVYETLLETFRSKLDAAESAEAVALTLDNFRDGFGKVLSKTAQADKRAAYKAELTAYKDALNADDYTAEAWARIESFVASYGEKIEAAETEVAMQTLTQAAKGEIDLVAKLVDKPAAGNKGCGARISTATGGIAVVLLSAAIIWLLRRKKRGEA